MDGNVFANVVSQMLSEMCVKAQEVCEQGGWLRSYTTSEDEDLDLPYRVSEMVARLSIKIVPKDYLLDQWAKDEVPKHIRDAWVKICIVIHPCDGMNHRLECMRSWFHEYALVRCKIRGHAMNLVSQQYTIIVRMVRAERRGDVVDCTGEIDLLSD